MLYRAMLWSSRKTIQVKKKNKSKLATESAVSSLSQLAVQPGGCQQGDPSQSRREHLSSGPEQRACPWHVSLLSALPCKTTARRSNLASCSPIIGDNAGDGTIPDCLSEPRAGLPSWQREPSLPSCLLPWCKLGRFGSQGNTTAQGALSCRGPFTGSTIFATENCVFAGHLYQPASALEMFFFSCTTCRVAY